MEGAIQRVVAVGCIRLLSSLSAPETQQRRAQLWLPARRYHYEDPELLRACYFLLRRLAFDGEVLRDAATTRSRHCERPAAPDTVLACARQVADHAFKHFGHSQSALTHR